jgi:hypothetical protein
MLKYWHLVGGICIVVGDGQEAPVDDVAENF